jgi:hypothetical protein
VLEQTLAGIWAGVLGLAQVGVRENFFELGGNSLHTMLIVELAGRAGIPMTVRQIFDCPTIEELASASSRA